jgi:hypothetical protein
VARELLNQLLSNVVSQTGYGRQEPVTNTKFFFGSRGQYNIKKNLKEMV